MIEKPSASEGHAADIFGDYEYEAPIPGAKTFLPWHRPRKQFVRDFQWLEQIKNLYADSGNNSGRLTYLGLPGIDLLDLRYFHTALCKEQKIILKFLGFNSAASPANNSQIEMAISLDEVTKLEHIDPGSDVIWDDFCQIGNTSSNAWRRARKEGPFDVINLDLCDGFGLQPPDCLAGTHYNALNQLLSLQSRFTSPWLLFLTTRAGVDHVNEEVFERLKEHYSRILDDCQAFKEFSTERFSIEDRPTLEQAIKTEGGLMSVFITGICNWLLNMAADQRPPTKVEVKSVVGYRVNSASTNADLISVALRFEPLFTANIDQVGLATNATPPMDLCSLSTRAIKRIASFKDVDDILANDSELSSQMIEDMAGLLEQARYDTQAYREWLLAEIMD